MTESSNKKAGEYVLKSFKISKLGEPAGPDNSEDIWKLIETWSFSESMSTGYMRGSAKVFDSDSVLDDFLGEQNGWLKGEEEIEIKIVDFYGKELTLNFFLYAITDVKIASEKKDNIYEYTIHFVSKEKFFSDRQLIRRGFRNGTISSYAQIIFNEYFKDQSQTKKPIKIQETSGEQNLVIPNYTPEETMHFLTRKAYISDETYSTQSFRFFESKEEFYFGTMEWIVKEYQFDEQTEDEGIPIFTRFEYADQSPEGQRTLMSSLLDIQYPTYVNTMEDMARGAYYKVTTELDYLNRVPLFTEYRYLDEYQKHYTDFPIRSKHSKEFVDEHFSIFPRDTLVFKDYKNPEQSSVESADYPYLRESTFYPQTYNDKNVSFYHHFNEGLQIKVYGRIQLTVGDIIELKLYDINYKTDDREIDEKRSGIYIIESVENIFKGDQFIQVMTISRSGFVGQPERADAYETGPQTESVWTERGGDEGGAAAKPGDENVREPGEAGKDNNEDVPREPETPSGRALSAEEENALFERLEEQEAERRAAAGLPREFSSSERASIKGILASEGGNSAANLATMLNRSYDAKASITDVVFGKNQFTPAAAASTGVNDVLAGRDPGGAARFSGGYINPARETLSSAVLGYETYRKQGVNYFNARALGAKYTPVLDAGNIYQIGPPGFIVDDGSNYQLFLNRYNLTE